MHADSLLLKFVRQKFWIRTPLGQLSKQKSGFPATEPEPGTVRTFHYYQPGSHRTSIEPRPKHSTSIRSSPRQRMKTTAQYPFESHQLTTKIRSHPNCPVLLRVPCVKGVFFPKKKERPQKPLSIEVSYWVLGTGYSVLRANSRQPLPQQPESLPQSPSLQCVSEHSPRWPRYRYKHPHKDAGFHPRASPAR